MQGVGVFDDFLDAQLGERKFNSILLFIAGKMNIDEISFYMKVGKVDVVDESWSFGPPVIKLPEAGNAD